ncbi:MAG: YeeE/YedE thiosulfate transporter family protein [Candidatus Binatia bacterium]
MSNPSPYAVGAGIGLLNAAAFATVGRGLGVTTAFEDAAALAEAQLAPGAAPIREYLEKREKKPEIGWESLLAVGVLAGSFLAAIAAGERTRPAVPPDWERRFGPDREARYAAAFAGGALMMFGARMAKGCTSGHAITGNSQLAVSSLVFSPIMFASAALAARAIYGGEGR